MTGGSVSIRRLRFDLDLRPGESIPGAVARAVGSHGLASVYPVMASAGLGHWLRPGLTQLLPEADLRRLAHVIRCDPDALAGMAGERLEHDGSGKVVLQRVRFGNLVLFRSHLDLLARRISPLTLHGGGHHRAAWLNVLMPFCPESLERLVATCARCGKGLGWAHSKGIGTCEHCAIEIAPSADPPLAAAFVDDYRLFARLASGDAGARGAAVAALPTMLHRLAPGDLVRIALRSGLVCRQAPLRGVRLTGLARLDPETVASIVSTGARLLRSWPEGIRDWAGREAVRCRDDLASYNRLRDTLRRMGQGDGSFADHTELMVETFPDLDRTISHSFAGGARYLLVHEVQLALGVAHDAVVRLREAGLLSFERVPGEGSRTRGRYNADQVETVAAVFRSSAPLTTCQAAFGLPAHAIEQFVCMELLEREEHPVVAALREGVRVRRSSMTALTDRLRKAASRKPMPLEAIRIRSAAARIGGRAKPWGAIYAALVEKRIPFWSAVSGSGPIDVRVRPADLERFDQVVFDESRWPDFPFQAEWHTADVGEVLNLVPVHVERIRSMGGLGVTTRAKARWTARGEVLMLARALVSSAELAYRENTSSRRVTAVLARAGRPGRLGMWDRDRVSPQDLVRRPRIQPSRARSAQGGSR